MRLAIWKYDRDKDMVSISILLIYCSGTSLGRKTKYL